MPLVQLLSPVHRLAIQTIDPLVVDYPTLPAKQYMHPLVAVTNPRRGNLLDAVDQGD